MYSCPSCNSQDVSGRSTCGCGADLTLLQQLDTVADAWFNRAREALAAGSPGRALEWLSAACAARPTDAAALRALAKVWAQLSRWTEARDALLRAADLDPEALELAAIGAALGDGEAGAPKARRAGARPKQAQKRNRKRKRRARR